MEKKILFVVALALLIPFVLAYSVQMNIDANVADFNTDVYACDDSACDSLSFLSSGNSYSLIGDGNDSFLEFDYKECFKPHIYEVHVWGDKTGVNSYLINLIKRNDCIASINSGSLSDSVINLGNSIDVSSSVRSAYELPIGVLSTTLIPGVLEDEYSSLIKVEFYANGVKIGEDEMSVLMGTNADFEIDWTPSTTGTYDISVVSSAIDCACLEPNPQTSYIGTVLVNGVPSCVEDIVFGDWSSWVNDSECIGGFMSQSRTKTEYDANSCGTFDDVIHTESRNVVCEMPCVEDVVNGSWSEWENGECVDNLMTRTRMRTEYDDNNCGTYSNVVYEESEDVECGEPVCYLDSDCGTPHCAGEPNYCDAGDVWQDFEVPECINAGELNSYCSYGLILPWLIQDCNYGCLFGTCLFEEDNDLDNDGYNYTDDCNDDNYYVNPGMAENCSTVYDDNCDGNVNEGCEVVCVEDVVNGSWSEWANISGCVNGTFWVMRTMIEYDNNSCGSFENVTYEEVRESNCSVVEKCSFDSNCTADYYGKRYCSEDDIYETFHYFTCVNGTCVENIIEKFVRECSDDCDDGRCVSDDDDSSWNGETVWIDRTSRVSPSVAVLNIGGEAGETSWMWLLWVLLIIGILFLVWMVFRLLSM